MSKFSSSRVKLQAQESSFKLKNQISHSRVKFHAQDLKEAQQPTYWQPTLKEVKKHTNKRLKAYPHQPPV